MPRCVDRRHSTSVPSLRGRLVARWTWQPDKWDRLLTVAELAGSDGSVLDVGGRGHELASLLGAARVTSLNVEAPADVVVPAGRLPYPDDAYDVVTSSDVLEHIPVAQRAAHVAELVRVAGRRVVIGVPCGSPGKCAAERDLADWMRAEHSLTLPFLAEHLEHGLPRPADVVDWARAADPARTVRVHFTGSYPEGDELLRTAVRARYGHDLRALTRFVVRWVLRRRFPLEQQQRPSSDRAFIVVERAGAR
ncbi:class I SAM-dependent methyltransferase [Nocardioides terrisoli]|uniref:class I SAM-dependent methyltransferase n=1 Tax=Nocardioides terrisoli TaxID=3388267 RepID=UPI00287B976F|nr:class I SAM-dependent methyltransferase [Nocardioides marmorisolisilvae]